MISLLVKLLVKFYLLHSTCLLPTTEQNFHDAYRKRAKLWVIACLAKLMKPNVNTFIASIDALIADSFQYKGILDVDTVERNVLHVTQERLLREKEEERIKAKSLEFHDTHNLPSSMTGLVSSQLESVQNEQLLDSTSLVDLVLNE